MVNATLGYLLHSGKNSKAGYYLKAGLRDLLPDALFSRRLEKELEACRLLYDESYINDRVDYYCRFDTPRSLGDASEAIGSLQRTPHGSTYYYDSRELLQWFNPSLRWNHLFGDIREIPPCPTVVKSRGLGCDNSNSVLLKLDKCRHYVYLKDRRPFAKKSDRAIFRGYTGIRENRKLFCSLYADNPRIDVAGTLSNGSIFSNERMTASTTNSAPRLSLYQHLAYRYIMALEGNDVASNLRWVMSSNSLAVMPKPTCESWFMEERLVPGVHYIEVKPDYSDLESQLDYYSSHLQEATEMGRQANLYVSQFRDERRERYIGLLVLRKYFNLTNP
ncbi:MAG: lipopolysaccharide biosynthesis protein [Bacteroidales bacterium]|nr:lipopolysaccharide biosynthesis protein [Bacteroidales bacterium]